MGDIQIGDVTQGEGSKVIDKSTTNDTKTVLYVVGGLIAASFVAYLLLSDRDVSVEKGADGYSIEATE